MSNWRLPIARVAFIDPSWDYLAFVPLDGRSGLAAGADPFPHRARVRYARLQPGLASEGPVNQLNTLTTHCRQSEVATGFYGAVAIAFKLKGPNRLAELVFLLSAFHRRDSPI